jgi:predicted aspartyl protease
MPRYSTEFDPPAPLIRFTVYCPVDHGRAVSIRGELDSGADISVVPQRVVDELQLIPRRVLVTQGYDGAQNQWATYVVDLEVEGHLIDYVEVIALPRQDAILGRDVLNHFIVTLNGKELAFDVTDP